MRKMSDIQPGSPVGIYTKNEMEKYKFEQKPEDGFDEIMNPAHYTEGRKYEPRKVIHDWELNFNLGCVVKYIARAGRKGAMIEDLKKARQYLDFEIEEMEAKD